MLTHSAVWTALDVLAERHGLSTSGLARAAGLDPTTFNVSKRIAPGTGKPRWPTLETLAKALTVLDVSFGDFAGLVDELVD